MIPAVGSSVVYYNDIGCPRNALVTAVHGETCVNLIYVSRNVQETDQYGRQIKRASSVVHKSCQESHGNYWQFG